MNFHVKEMVFMTDDTASKLCLGLAFSYHNGLQSLLTL